MSMTTQPSDWAVAQAMREFKPVFRSTTWTHAEEWILNRARELDDFDASRHVLSLAEPASRDPGNVVSPRTRYCAPPR